MTEENWMPVANFPWYEVSSLGRLRRTVSTTCSKAGTIISGHVGKHGYRYFNATLNGRRKTLKIHRLVCEAFHGPAPSPKHCVAHGDGDCLNNAASNLRWATTKENHEDRRLHGTHPTGSLNPRAVLSENDVISIRRIYQSGGMTTYQLGERYGVNASVIQKLLKRETWKHVA